MEVTTCVIRMIGGNVEVSVHNDVFILQVIVIPETLLEEHGAFIVVLHGVPV